MLANQALNYLVSGKVPKRIGNAHPNIVPYQVFPVADGHIIIATGNDSQFAKLCAVLGDPKIAGGAALSRQLGSAGSPRRVDRAPLRPDLGAGRGPTLLARLEEVQVPAGPINPLDQVFADPQVRHRGMRHRASERGRQGRHHPGRAHARS